MNRKAQGSAIKFIIILIAFVFLFIAGSRLMQNFLSPRTDLLLNIDPQIKKDLISSMPENKTLYIANTTILHRGISSKIYVALRNNRNIPTRYFMKVKEATDKLESKNIIYYKGPLKIKPGEISIQKIIVPILNPEENYNITISLEMEKSIRVIVPLDDTASVELKATQ